MKPHFCAKSANRTYVLIDEWEPLACQSLVFGKNLFSPTKISLKSMLPLNSKISQRVSVYMHGLLVQALAINLWELVKKTPERER